MVRGFWNAAVAIPAETVDPDVGGETAVQPTPSVGPPPAGEIHPKCMNCGATIDIHAEACGVCGSPFLTRCKTCNTPVSAKWNQCPECGTQFH